MTDFLSTLIAREMKQLPVIKPRVPSLFEPISTSQQGYLQTEPAGLQYEESEKTRDAPHRRAHQGDKSPQPQNGAAPPAAGSEKDREISSDENVRPRRSRPDTPRHRTDEKPFSDNSTAISTLQPQSLSRASEPGESPSFVQAGSSPDDPAQRTTAASAPGRIAQHESDVQRDSKPNRRPYSAGLPARAVTAEMTSPASGKPPLPLLNRSQYPFLTIPTPEKTEPPVIRVTIGRIDVRAVVTSEPTRPAPVGRSSAVPSLEEYLKKRNEGIS